MRAGRLKAVRRVRFGARLNLVSGFGGPRIGSKGLRYLSHDLRKILDL